MNTGYNCSPVFAIKKQKDRLITFGDVADRVCRKFAILARKLNLLNSGKHGALSYSFRFVEYECFSTESIGQNLSFKSMKKHIESE